MQNNHSDQSWFYANKDQSVGPYAINDLVHEIKRKFSERSLNVLVFGPATGGAWITAASVAEINVILNANAAPPPPPHAVRPADDIDVEVFGDDTQYAEVCLDPGESVVTESGAMLFMDADVEMQTFFGDDDAKDFGTQALEAGKKFLMGEKLFLNVYTNKGKARRKIAFSAPSTGKICILDLKELGGEIICQKDAFLVGARGVKIDLHVHSDVMLGLFGGEGFIMQKVSGSGKVLLHAGGMVLKKSLARNEELIVDSGCLVAYQPSVDFSVRSVKGVTNTVFGGEGFAVAVLKGPGQIWLQSLPFSRFSSRVMQAAIAGKGGDEGSLLGNLSGVGQGGILGGLGELAGVGGTIGALAKLGRIL